MPDVQNMTPGEVLAEASVAEFIKALGLSIAEAQTALDENSVNQIAHFVEPRDSLDGKSLLDLGLSPAFYHYQHADISCSIQLSLKIAEETGVDLNLSGNFGDTSTSDDSSSESSSETTSGSSTRRSTRSARVQIAMSSQGALRVGGNNFQLQGADPMARIADLAARLRADPQSGIQRVLPTEQCGPVNPQEVPEQAEVVTTPNSVAFMNGPDYRLAIIRIAEVPGAAEEYVLAEGHRTTVQPGASVHAHAQAVQSAINALGYRTTLLGNAAGDPVEVIRHRHDIHRYDDPPTYRPEQDENVKALAIFYRETGVAGELVGHTDRTGTDTYNQGLGQRRADYVREKMVSHGAPAANLPARSVGEQPWGNAPGPENNEEHRIVQIRRPANYPYLIVVRGDDAHPIDRNQVSPAQFGDATGTDNGFVAVSEADTDPLTGRIDIGQHQFALNGAAAGGHGANMPESYARNLAAAINGNEAAGVHASAIGNVVHLCPAGSRFELLLVTSESRNIELSGTDDITVTEQFSRTQTRNVSQQRTGNRTIAVGASLGVRHQRQYEMNISGNSTISARLVSIPAPPEFLATIKDYLS